MIKLDSYFSQLKTKKTEGNVLIFCQIRKKWLQAAPEEVVRQTVVAYLIDHGVPTKHITVEKKITVGKLSRRYDVVVANLRGEYYLLVECKAPEVPINQGVVDQAGVYNLTLIGQYIWLTNGHHNKIFEIDHKNKTSKEIENIPLRAHYPNSPKVSSINQSNKRVADWSYDHFVAYLMLYASYADYDYSQKEKENILSLVNQDILSEVEVEFEKLGDYAQLDLIMQLKKVFIKTEEDKSKILELLNTQFSADGDYSRLETALYTFLEKLL